MPKALRITITKSSFQIGWMDTIERNPGRNLADGVDAAAYRRGVARAEEFIRRISAANRHPKQDASCEPFGSLWIKL